MKRQRSITRRIRLMTPGDEDQKIIEYKLKSPRQPSIFYSLHEASNMLLIYMPDNFCAGDMGALIETVPDELGKNREMSFVLYPHQWAEDRVVEDGGDTEPKPTDTTH